MILDRVNLATAFCALALVSVNPVTMDTPTPPPSNHTAMHNRVSINIPNTKSKLANYKFLVINILYYINITYIKIFSFAFDQQ